MGCAASTDSSTTPASRWEQHPGSPPASPAGNNAASPGGESGGGLKRKGSLRFAENRDISDQERVQLERIAKNRPQQNTLGTEEDSLARYDVVTFGIKDDTYYNTNVTVVERSSFSGGAAAAAAADVSSPEGVGSPHRRTGSIIRKASLVIDGNTDAELSCSGEHSPPALTRTPSKKKVLFS